MIITKYNNWLRGLVERPGPIYNILFDIAWDEQFTYYIPNDDNRAQDGLELRRKYEQENGNILPVLGECKMLEFLIALSIRLNEAVYDYENPDQTSYWFWVLMKNLHVDTYDDDYPFNEIHRKIRQTFVRLNERHYNHDGSAGGLFPLENPSQDQREVEVWYQMMAYLLENVT